MTIQGWIAFIVISAVVMGFAVLFTWLLRQDYYDNPPKKTLIPIFIGIIIIGTILGGALFYYNKTEPGKRAYHTQQSELGGGLNRTVRVYDVEGDLIAEYSGQFDIEYDEERIIFDDENGLRHIIYFSVSTVIIDEEE